MNITAKYFLTSLVLIALTACSPRVDYRGKAPESKELAKIKVDTHTHHDVLNLIGSPTFETKYGKKIWFYVYKKTNSTAFFNADIVEKNTLAITFDDKGIVRNIEDMDPDMQAITPITHTTPTVGSDRTILQQVFSNFGRSAKKSDKK